MMKQVVFITQSKGGCGKSILAYLFAEKYQDAQIIDMDDATKTSSKQLAYREPLYVKFLNQTNTIDRGAFHKFIERVASMESSIIICDMGASVSEQLPYYLEDMKDVLPGILEALEISLSIYCVVGGGNLFSSTMKYLDDLYKRAEGNYSVNVFRNDYFWFNEKQEQEFYAYIKHRKLPSFTFNISKDPNEMTQNRIREVLESGQGIQKASLISKAFFQMAIKKLPGLEEDNHLLDAHEPSEKKKPKVSSHSK